MTVTTNNCKVMDNKRPMSQETIGLSKQNVGFSDIGFSQLSDNGSVLDGLLQDSNMDALEQQRKVISYVYVYIHIYTHILVCV